MDLIKELYIRYIINSQREFLRNSGAKVLMIVSLFLIALIDYLTYEYSLEGLKQFPFIEWMIANYISIMVVSYSVIFICIDLAYKKRDSDVNNIFSVIIYGLSFPAFLISRYIFIEFLKLISKLFNK